MGFGWAENAEKDGRAGSPDKGLKSRNSDRDIYYSTHLLMLT